MVLDFSASSQLNPDIIYWSHKSESTENDVHQLDIPILAPHYPIEPTSVIPRSPRPSLQIFPIHMSDNNVQLDATTETLAFEEWSVGGITGHWYVLPIKEVPITIYENRSNTSGRRLNGDQGDVVVAIQCEKAGQKLKNPAKAIVNGRQYLTGTGGSDYLSRMDIFQKFARELRKELPDWLPDGTKKEYKRFFSTVRWALQDKALRDNAQMAETSIGITHDLFPASSLPRTLFGQQMSLILLSGVSDFGKTLQALTSKRAWGEKDFSREELEEEMVDVLSGYLPELANTTFKTIYATAKDNVRSRVHSERGSRLHRAGECHCFS